MGKLKHTNESVLPVTEKEGKGKGKWSIGPKLKMDVQTCVHFVLKQTVGFAYKTKTAISD